MTTWENRYGTRRVTPDGSAWLQAHAEDRIGVRLIDLLSVAGRLADLERDPADAMAVHRLVTCDLPRLRDYLPERALDEI